MVASKKDAAFCSINTHIPIARTYFSFLSVVLSNVTLRVLDLMQLQFQTEFKRIQTELAATDKFINISSQVLIEMPYIAFYSISLEDGCSSLPICRR